MDQNGVDDSTTTTPTASTTAIDDTLNLLLHDNLYVKFHDGLFDIICTTDTNAAEERGLSIKRHMSAQVTALEASAASRIRPVSTMELPPEVRGCITTTDIKAPRPRDDILGTGVAVKDQLSSAAEVFEDNDDRISDNDFDDDDNIDGEENDVMSYQRGRGRLASLLSVQGYGLDVSDLHHSKYTPTTEKARYSSSATRRQQRQPKRKRSTSESGGPLLTTSREAGSDETKTTTSAECIVNNLLWPPKVLSDSAAIRAEFKEEFEPDFFPRSYQVTEIYLPRTIYEKHSLRYRAKKRIRPDRDTLSGLIVTLRKDPPPWGFV